MAAHGSDGIAEGGAILDFQPLNGIGIVAAPDLGEIVEHSRIKPSAAAAAALKEHLGEFGCQPFQQSIQTQHIPVGCFSLTLRGEHTAVNIRQASVHVPLHIADVMAAE